MIPALQLAFAWSERRAKMTLEQMCAWSYDINARPEDSARWIATLGVEAHERNQLVLLIVAAGGPSDTPFAYYHYPRPLYRMLPDEERHQWAIKRADGYLSGRISPPEPPSVAEWKEIAAPILADADREWRLWALAVLGWLTAREGSASRAASATSPRSAPVAAPAAEPASST